MTKKKKDTKKLSIESLKKFFSKNKNPEIIAPQDVNIGMPTSIENMQQLKKDAEKLDEPKDESDS